MASPWNGEGSPPSKPGFGQRLNRTSGLWRRQGMQKSRCLPSNLTLTLRPALVLLLSVTSSVFAEPRAWDGGGGADHSWQNTLNWSPDGVPTTTSDVTFGSVITPGLTISSTGFAFVNSINISTLNAFTI